MINAIETLAVAKLITSSQQKSARKLIGDGMRNIDFCVHITGKMDVGADYLRTVPQKAKPWELLAVALSRLNGITVESLTREALTANPETVASIKSRAAQAIAEIKGSTETVCAGRVDATLEAEVTTLPLARVA